MEDAWYQLKGLCQQGLLYFDTDYYVYGEANGRPHFWQVYYPTLVLYNSKNTQSKTKESFYGIPSASINTGMTRLYSEPRI